MYSLKNTIKHLVFLTPGFPQSEEDSTTIPALQIYIKKLQQSLPEMDITVITFQYPFSNKIYDWNGIKVVPLNGKNQRIKKILIWNKAIKKIKKIRQKSPSIVLHSLWIGECSFIGQKLAVKYAVRHITTAMGQDVDSSNRYVKYLKKSNAPIVTLSKNHADLLLKNHALKSKIIPWYIDTSLFPLMQPNEIDILGVGSLNTIKNYSTYLKVIKELKKFHPNLKVEIIGEGNNRRKLEKIIKHEKLENTVTLIGILANHQVLYKMAKSKILLHTSNYESYGYVFAEALYSGMHIVSFNVGIAQKKKEWSICNTVEEIISTCNELLNIPDQEKKRTLMYLEEETLYSYLKLYNA